MWKNRSGRRCRKITRTVRTADEISQRVESLPVDVAEFMLSMMELSRRLSPLINLAESGAGMFRMGIPSLGRQNEPTVAAPPSPQPATTARKAPAKRSGAKSGALPTLEWLEVGRAQRTIFVAQPWST